jgi:hypothetical protein
MVQTSLFEEKSTETLLYGLQSFQSAARAMHPSCSAPCASANNQGIECAGLMVA